MVDAAAARTAGELITQLEPRRLLSDVPIGISPVVDTPGVRFVDTPGGLRYSTVPALSSKPKATKKLYIDFDGDTTPQWTGVNFQPGTTPAFDANGDPSSFSSGEVDLMRQVWADVAEKYSPFDIDVTTVAPPSLADNVAFRIVVGGDGTWYNLNRAPGTSIASGVAIIGGFVSPAYSNTGYVFSALVPAWPTNVQFVAETVAHEAGHGFGLSHIWGRNASNAWQEYSPGDANTVPIMGLSNFAPAKRGTWVIGPIGTNGTAPQQNDVQVLGTVIGYGAADNDDTQGTATLLTPDGTNVLAASGVINKVTDVDYYKFDARSGDLRIRLDAVTPRYMLDAIVELRNSAGTVLASASTNNNPSAELVQQNAAAGQYYVSVRSANRLPGDIGQYKLSASITNGRSLTDVAGLLDGKVSGVTIITHGFQSSVSGGDSMMSLAQAIRERNQGWLLDLDVSEPGQPLVADVGQSVLPSPTGPQGTPRNLVVLYDWAAESSVRSSTGYAASAGSALAATLGRLGLLIYSTYSDSFMPLHFIGHSFGAAVTAEAVKRLGAIGFPVDQVTYLDPHDFIQKDSELVDGGSVAGSTFETAQGESFLSPMEGYGAATYSNVAFTDSYYQTESLADVVPEGRPIPGAYNYGVNVPSAVIATGTMTGHTYVWSDWYASTVRDSSSLTGYRYAWTNYTAAKPARPAPKFWLPAGNVGVGEQHQHTPAYLLNHTTGANNVPLVTVNTQALTDHGLTIAGVENAKWGPNVDALDLVNGDFRFGPGSPFSVTGTLPALVPGWSSFGEAPSSADVIANPDRAGDFMLRLTPTRRTRTHDLALIPGSASRLKLRIKQATNVRVAEELSVIVGTARLGLTDAGGGEYFAILPEGLRGTAQPISIELSGTAAAGAIVDVDDVRFEALMGERQFDTPDVFKNTTVAFYTQIPRAASVFTFDYDILDPSDDDSITVSFNGAAQPLSALRVNAVRKGTWSVPVPAGLQGQAVNVLVQLASANDPADTAIDSEVAISKLRIASATSERFPTTIGGGLASLNAVLRGIVDSNDNSNVFSRRLAFFGKSARELGISPADVFAESVLPVLSDFLQRSTSVGQAPQPSGLQDLLRSLGVAGTNTSAVQQVGGDLVVTLQFAIENRRNELSVSAAQVLSKYNIDGSLQIDANVRTTFDLKLRLANWATNPTVSAEFGPSGTKTTITAIPGTLRVPLGERLLSGIGRAELLEASGFNLRRNLQIAPVSGGNGILALAPEVGNVGSALRTLVGIEQTGSVAATLDLRMKSTVPRVGSGRTDPPESSVLITTQDFLNDADSLVTPDQNFVSELAGMARTTAATLRDMLRQVGSWFDNFRSSDLFNVATQLAKGTKFGEVVNLADVWRNKIDNLLTNVADADAAPSFGDVLDLVGLPGIGLSNVQFDPASGQLVFSVDMSRTLSPIVKPIGLDLDLGAKLKNFVSVNSSITLTPSVSGSFTLALDLDPLGEAEIPNAINTTSADIPLSNLKRWTGAVTSTTPNPIRKLIVTVGATPYTVDFTGATKVSDLLNSLNAALGSAGVTASYDPSTRGLRLRVPTSKVDSAEGLTVSAFPGSTAAADLSLAGVVATEESDGNYVLAGGGLHAETIADRILIRNGDLTARLQASATNVNATADFGFAGISIVGGSLSGDANVRFIIGPNGTLSGSTQSNPISLRQLLGQGNRLIAEREMPGSGKLTQDVSFALDIRRLGFAYPDGTAGNPYVNVTVTAASTNDNVEKQVEVKVGQPEEVVPATQMLVDDVNAALRDALTARGLAQDLIVASREGNRLVLAPKSLTSGVLSLRVHAPTATLDANALGLRHDQSAFAMNIDVGGSLTGTLPIKLNPEALQAVAGTSSVGVNWTDVGDPSTFTLTGVPDIVDRLSSLVSFDSFGDITSDGVLGALDKALGYLTALPGVSGALNTKLPGINKSVLDIVGITKNVESFIQSYRQNPASTLAGLEEQLEDLLGIPDDPANPNSPLVTLRADGSNALGIDITFTRALPQGTELGFNFDLDQWFSSDLLKNLIDASGSAKLRIDADATFKLGIGIDMSQPVPRPFLYTDPARTSFTISAGVTNPSPIQFTAALGPIGVKVVAPANSIVIAGQGSAPRATFNVSLTDDATVDGRLYVVSAADLSNVVAHTQSSLSGRASVSLPFFKSLDSTSIGTLSVSTNDLSQALSSWTVNSLPALDSLVTDVANNIFGSLRGGWDGIFTLLEDALDGQMFGVKLPLIGDKFKNAARFLLDMRSSLNGTLATLNNAADPATMRQALFNAFGPSGLGWLKRVDGATTAPTIADVVPQGTVNSNGALYKLHLAFSPVAVNLPLNFDLGLPALGLDVSGGIRAEVGIDWTLGFGVSRSLGAYINLGSASPDAEDLAVDFKLSIPNLNATGRLGFLKITAKDRAANPSVFAGRYSINLKDGNDQNLTLTELPGFLAGSLSSLVDGKLTANGANNGIRLDIDTAISGAGGLPKLSTTLDVDWDIDNAAPDGNGYFANAIPHVSFGDVYLDASEFFNNFVTPVIGRIQKVLQPVKPLIDALLAPLPVISTLRGQPTTILDVMGIPTPGFLKTAQQVLNGFGNLSGIASGKIKLGSLSLQNNARAGGGWLDLRNGVNLASTSINNLNWSTDPNDPQSLQNLKSTNAAVSSFFNSTGNVGGGESKLSFPLIENPKDALKLLLGQDLELVRFDTGKLSVQGGVSWYFPIIGPLGARIGGLIGAEANFVFSFDTFGIREALRTGNASDVFKGFFLDDDRVVNGKGPDLDEARIYGGLYAAAELNLGFAKGGVGGGLTASLNFNLNDPNNDGKVRLNEIADNLELGPIHVFDVKGKLEVGLFGYVKIDLGFFKKEFKKDFGKFTLLSYDFPRPVRPNTRPVISALQSSTLYTNTGSRASLRVNGDLSDGADDVRILPDGANRIEVRIAGQSRFYGVNVAGKDDVDGPMPSRIIIETGGGADRITIDPGVTVPVEIDAGDQSDTIVAGGGPVTVKGGAGDDVIDVSLATLPAANNYPTSGTPTRRIAAIVNGEGGSDRIIGSAYADAIDGGISNDWVDGAAGDDLIYGGDGNDTLLGGTGGDTISALAGDDTVEGQNGDDSLLGGDGADSLTGGLDQDTLVGDDATGFADRLVGNEGNDSILGGGGNDSIEGGLGSDRIAAGEGNDTVDAGPANDQIDGGPGNDLLYGGLGSEQNVTEGATTYLGIDGGEGDDTIYAYAADGTRESEAIADNIYGGPGNDLIYGDDGADSIVAGLGSDTVYGLWGSDNIVLGTAPDGSGLQANADVNFAYGDDYLSIVPAPAGSANADQIYGDVGIDSLFGQVGNDTIVGNAGADSIVADQGDDLVYAGALPAGFGTRSLVDASRTTTAAGPFSTFAELGYNQFLGAGGRALIDGFVDAGDDTVRGGDGIDYVFGAGGDDLLDGGTGDDYVDAGGGRDFILGGTGLDVLRGGANEDTVFGNEDVDQIYGDADSDQLFGDAGSSTGVQLGQRLFGGDGIDYLFGYAPSYDTARNGAEAGLQGDALYGEAGDDWLYGNLRRETLFGGTGSDYLGGDALAGPNYLASDRPNVLGGADVIDGGAGQDQLYGGGGADTLAGGDDEDWVEGQDGSDSASGGAGNDLLVLDTDPSYLPTDLDDFNGNADLDTLLIAGTQFNDSIVLAGASGQLSVTHTIGNGAPRTLIATVAGRVERFRVSALGGNDVVSTNLASPPPFAASASNWTLVVDGGPGNDTLSGSNQRDYLDGGPGSDLIQGFGGDDQLWGGQNGSTADRDTLRGGWGDDDMIGGSGFNDLDPFTFGRAATISANPMFGVVGFVSDAPTNRPNTASATAFVESTIAVNAFTLGSSDVSFALNFGDYRANLMLTPSALGSNAALTSYLSAQLASINAALGTEVATRGARISAGTTPTATVSATIESSGKLRFTLTTTNLRAVATAGEAGDGLIRLPSIAVGYEETGLNRALGGTLDDADLESTDVNADGAVNFDRLYGGTGLDFLWGNSPLDQIIGVAGNVLQDASGGVTEADGRSWLDYARASNKVWYYQGTDSADDIEVGFGRVSFDGTSAPDQPFLHYIRRITRPSSGSSWRDTQMSFRLDFARFANRTFDAFLSLPGDAQYDTAARAAALRAAFVDPNAQVNGLFTRSGASPLESDFTAIIVDGLGGNDKIVVGDSVQKSVWVDGGAGSDSVLFVGALDDQTPAPAQRHDVAIGGPGDDTLIGGPTNDWIFGGDGADVLGGGADAKDTLPDLIFGGAGNDTLQLVPQPQTVAAADLFTGGAGFDRVAYESVSYAQGSVLGAPRNDLAVRDFVALRYDTLDRAYTLASAVPALNASNTSTFLPVAAGSTVAARYVEKFRAPDAEQMLINVGAGNDTVTVGDLSWADAGSNPPSSTSFGISESIIRRGATLPIAIIGGDGDDVLVGSAADDTILGKAGADQIYGNAGNDLLAGGGANDTIVGDGATPTIAFPTADPNAFERLWPSPAATDRGTDVSQTPISPVRPGIDLGYDDANAGPLVNRPISDAWSLQNDLATNVLGKVLNAGDLNSDGYADFVITGSTYSLVFLGPIDFQAIFGVPVVTTGSAGANDFRLDVAPQQHFGLTGRADFLIPTSLFGQIVASADITGDRKPDLIGVGSAGTSLNLLRSDVATNPIVSGELSQRVLATGQFVTQTINQGGLDTRADRDTTTGTDWSDAIAVVNFDGTGASEIALRASTGGASGDTRLWRFNTASGLFESAAGGGTNQTQFTGNSVAGNTGVYNVGDVNGDGAEDLLFIDTVGSNRYGAVAFGRTVGGGGGGGGQINYLTAPDIRLNFGLVSGTSPATRVAALGDIARRADGTSRSDGYDDFAVTHPGVPNQWQIIGGASQAVGGTTRVVDVVGGSLQFISGGSSADGLVAGDFDNDRRRDLVSSSANVARLFSGLTLGNSYGLSDSAAVNTFSPESGAVAQSLAVLDVTGDGIDDLLVLQSQSAGQPWPVQANLSSIGTSQAGELYVIPGAPRRVAVDQATRGTLSNYGLGGSFVVGRSDGGEKFIPAGATRSTDVEFTTNAPGAAGLFIQVGEPDLSLSLMRFDAATNSYVDVGVSGASLAWTSYAPGRYRVRVTDTKASRTTAVAFTLLGNAPVVEPDFFGFVNGVGSQAIDAGATEKVLQFTTLGDGLPGDFIRLVEPSDASGTPDDLRFDLLDANGGVLASNVDLLDFRRFRAGTYQLRVFRTGTSPSTTQAKPFTLSMQMPLAGASQESSDRDDLYGGNETDALIGGRDLDRLVDIVGTSTNYTSERAEIREFDATGATLPLVTDATAPTTPAPSTTWASNTYARPADPFVDQPNPRFIDRSGATYFLSDRSLAAAIADALSSSQAGREVTASAAGKPIHRGRLRASDIGSVLDLNASGNNPATGLPYGITSLAGLQFASRVERVDLSNNPSINSLAALEPFGTGVASIGAQGIRSLKFNGDTVVDLAPVSGMRTLEVLEGNANQIVKVGPLATLPRLQVLKLANNRIVDIAALAGQFVVDTADADYKETNAAGTVLAGEQWTGNLNANAFGGDYRIKLGTGTSTESSKAVWTFTGLPAGAYDVYVTWPEQKRRSSAAVYRISGTTATGTANPDVAVDQRQAPVGSTFGGRPWQRIDTQGLYFASTSATASVELLDANGNHVAADAVRLVMRAPGLSRLYSIDVSNNPLNNTAHFAVEPELESRTRAADPVRDSNGNPIDKNRVAIEIGSVVNQAPTLNVTGPLAKVVNNSAGIQTVDVLLTTSDDATLPVNAISVTSSNANVSASIIAGGIRITTQDAFRGVAAITITLRDGTLAGTGRTATQRLTVTRGQAGSSDGAVLVGRKFDDVNTNGALDTGELVDEGDRVWVDLNTNNIIDSGEPVAVTDASGAYTFTNVAALTSRILRAQITNTFFGLSTPIVNTASGTVSTVNLTAPLVSEIQYQVPSAGSGSSLVPLSRALDEGEQVTLTARGRDPTAGTPLQYQWTITPPGGGSIVIPAAGPSSSVTQTFTPTVAGVYQVSLTVFDGGSPYIDASQLLVRRSAPRVELGSPLSISEGTNTTLSNPIVSPVSGRAYTYAWELYSNGNLIPTTANTGSSFTLPALDDGTYTVRLLVTDPNVLASTSDDLFGSDEVTIAISDAKPRVPVAPSDPVPYVLPTGVKEGDSPVISIPIVDAGGLADPILYRWTVTRAGEVLASGTNPLDANGAVVPVFGGSSIAIPFVPDDDGNYVVRVELSEIGNALAATTWEATLSVGDVVPTGTLGFTAPPVEGGEATFGFLTVIEPSSADRAKLRYSFDLNNDGDYADPGEVQDGTSPLITLAFPESGPQPAIRATVRDPSKPQATTTTLFSAYTVANAAPTATLGVDLNGEPVSLGSAPTGPEAVSVTATEGDSLTVSLLDAADISPGDYQAGLQFQFDLNGDGDFVDPNEAWNGSPTRGIASLPTGAWTITGSVRDRNGGISSYAIPIVVANVAPTVDVSFAPAHAQVEGLAASLIATATDVLPGQAFTYAWSVVSDNGQTIAPGSASTFSFVPSDNGLYTVTLVVSDGTSSTTRVIPLAIANAAPVVTSASGPSTAAESQSLSYSLDGWTDAAPDFAAAYHVEWRVTNEAGLLVAEKNVGPALQGAIDRQFSFAPRDNGTYSITVRVIDRDGDAGTLTKKLVVANAVPTLADLGSDRSITLGQSIVVPASAVVVSDAGPDDTFTFRWEVSQGSAGVVYTTESTTDRSLSYTPAAQGAYSVRLIVTDDDGGVATDSFAVNVGASVGINVTSRAFVYTPGAARLEIVFDSDASGLSASSFTLTNTDSSTAVTNFAASYNAGSRTWTLTFPVANGFADGSLADGRYRLALASGAGTMTPLDFFSLAGDANHDGTVNFTDLLIFASNYSQSPRSFGEGDFNYDGVVNFSDLLILAARYNFSINTPVPPTVTGSALQLNGVPNERLTVAFSTDVGASLASGDFELRNLTTNAVVTGWQLSYAGTTATIDVAGASFPQKVLPDGRYRLTVIAAGVTNASGTPMASNYTFDFVSLRGDANVNNTVNFDDLLVLAANYNQSGRSWSQGDFTFDGVVNFDDLLALASNYNRTIAGAPPPPLLAGDLNDGDDNGNKEVLS
jgi:Ca2+-binding RTX toxin-like protein